MRKLRRSPSSRHYSCVMSSYSILAVYSFSASFRVWFLGKLTRRREYAVSSDFVAGCNRAEQRERAWNPEFSAGSTTGA